MLLVCPNINLTLCAGYVEHYSLYKFCASEAAMEENYPFNEDNKTRDGTLEMRQLLSKVTMLQPSIKTRMSFFICKA